MACGCHSYNWNIGTVPERLLNYHGKIVCVDDCIAKTIQHLWDNGIETESCCCGHGRQCPSVIISSEYNDRDIKDRIYPLIKQVDWGDWHVLQWQLIDTKTGKRKAVCDG